MKKKTACDDCGKTGVTICPYPLTILWGLITIKKIHICLPCMLKRNKDD